MQLRSDMIAKEFHKHEKCYSLYTRIVRENVFDNWSIKRDEEFSRGNLYAVLRFTVYVMLMHGLDKQAVFSDTLLCRSLM